MQYKIPVQIENEDPIFLGLSLRQLIVIMVWFWMSYSIFKNLEIKTWSSEIALIPSILLAILTVLVAIFKHYEMTFIPFILAFFRYLTNARQRTWMNSTDSFQPIDIWFVTSYEDKWKDKVDFKSKIDKINELEEKLKKI